MRQESTAPSAATRLLSVPVVPVPRATTEDDAWAVRLSALAALGQYDGLGFITIAAVPEARGYNVSAQTLADDAVRAAAEDLRTAATPIRATLTLEDGRAATSALAAPLLLGEAAAGALIALRAGRAFAAADAPVAYKVAELVGLEVARSVAARHEAADRRQALTLYELARLALFGTDPHDTLQNVVAMLADTLAHDMAQVWLMRPRGSLELHAAHPGDVPFAVVRPEDDEDFFAALRGRGVLVVRDAAVRPWLSRDVRSLLLAPLRRDDRTVGLLVFGRVARPFEAADQELAGALAAFIARMVSGALDEAEPMTVVSEDVRSVDIAEDRELIESASG